MRKPAINASGVSSNNTRRSRLETPPARHFLSAITSRPPWRLPLPLPPRLPSAPTLLPRPPSWHPPLRLSCRHRWAREQGTEPHPPCTPRPTMHTPECPQRRPARGRRPPCIGGLSSNAGRGLINVGQIWAGSGHLGPTLARCWPSWACVLSRLGPRLVRFGPSWSKSGRVKQTWSDSARPGARSAKHWPGIGPIPLRTWARNLLGQNCGECGAHLSGANLTWTTPARIRPKLDVLDRICPGRHRPKFG